MSERVTIAPDAFGYYRCPICRRTCVLDYLVNEHVGQHRYSVDGQSFAELQIEVIGVIRDRYAARKGSTDG